MQAFDAEADDFIRKPFSPKEMLARVQVGVRLSQAQLGLESGGNTVSEASAAESIDDITAADRALGEESGRNMLTGLTNRIFATSRLCGLFEDRSLDSISVVALSIDGLFAATSELGPLLTNEITRRVALCLSSSVRKSDILCTSDTGGFLVLCPSSDLDSATSIAERLRKEVEADAITLEGYHEVVTVSAGVAERSDATPSPAALLQLAEAALEFGAMDGPNQIHPAA